MPNAARVSHALSRNSGASRRHSRTVGAFLAHFANVWLALLIGALLLLDFGDAWIAMAREGDVVGVGLTFLLGVAGTYFYLFIDLRRKTRSAPDDQRWRYRTSQWQRLTAFLLVCLAFTFLLTFVLWFLLSGTDEVVHGPGAALHITVWTGFALFVGVFFGLLAEASRSLFLSGR